jgi:AP-4 complex subunit epsilon-1
MWTKCAESSVTEVPRPLPPPPLSLLIATDPSVMGASLILLHAMIVADPLPYKDLVPSFVSILKQIIEHRLPREFDYHRIPAPWIQLHLLRILAVLGRGDQQSSEGMYEILVDAMRRADTGINVGYAIVYETVKTITTIYPNPLLLDAAATAISRFIRSDSHNLKYIGIKGLATIVKDHPKYAADHQMAVIDCLEDPDETLKRKTVSPL